MTPERPTAPSPHVVDQDPTTTMVLYRLGQIESHLSKMTHPLEHAQLVRRVELLERQGEENRKLARTTLVGALVALVVPTATYLAQLGGVLPSG